MSPQIRSEASSGQSGEPKSSSITTFSSSLDGEKVKSLVDRKVVYEFVTNPKIEFVHFMSKMCVKFIRYFVQM